MTQPVTPPPTPADPPQTGTPATGEPAAGPAATPPTGGSVQEADAQLGAAGIKALQAERDARKTLERQLADLAPLRKIAEALGGGDPAKGQTEIGQLNERLAAQEKAFADERAARLRLEVASEKGLTTAQARRLQGGTREELEADAADLVAAFATAGATPAKPTGPKPDPTQGGHVAPAAEQITLQQMQAMTPAQRVKAFNEGRLAHLL